MITSGVRSARSALLQCARSCEASSSRRVWQGFVASSSASFHLSSVRREPEGDSTQRIRTTTAKQQESAEQDKQQTTTATSSAPSAFSMPTLLPTEALPESFRATQSPDADLFASSPSPSSSRNVYGARREPHRLHILSTRNNTIVTLTTSAGDVLARISPGALGFRNAARSSYDAAYRAAIHMFERIEADRVGWQLARLEIIWNGFGQGREAVYRAMLSAEGNQVRNLVTKMSDNTPIKVGGTRPKKRRML